MLIWIYSFLHIEKTWKGGLCWRIWRDCSWLWMKLLMEGKWWQGSGQEKKVNHLFELDTKGKQHDTKHSLKKGSLTSILFNFPYLNSLWWMCTRLWVRVSVSLTLSSRVILESDPQQVVHRVALRVSSLVALLLSTILNDVVFVKILNPTLIIPLGGWCAFNGADSHSGENRSPVFYLCCKSFNCSIS